MFKNLIFSFIVIVATSSIANAQLFSFSPSGNDAPKNNFSPSATNKVLSPEEFKNRVDTLSQQNQSGLNQQANQMLSKQTPLPPSPPVADTRKQKPAETNSLNTTPAVPTPTDSASSADTTPEETAPTLPSASSSTDEAASIPPPQNQTYMGFQGTGTSSGSSSSSKSSGSSAKGGWNIQY